jgi:NitT/TauT family transport system substrate-binding protein
VISGAWEHLEFTLDPIASSLRTSADDAIEVGLLEPVDLDDPGIYDLALLNEVLDERGGAAVDDASELAAGGS